MLKKNVNYVLHRLVDVPYLLPYGQCIADHKKGIKINETGVVIWNLLDERMSRQELLARFLSYYDAPQELHLEMQKDMEDFVRLLLSYGILLDDEEKVVLSGAISRFYRIGPICVKIVAPENVFPKEFAVYEVAEDEANLAIELKLELPRTMESGNWLVRNKEIMVFENKEQFLIQFLQLSHLSEAFLLKDGSLAEICYTPAMNSNLLQEELFHAIRFLYLYTVQLKGCFAIHSASVLYQDKAWLFSGHSGAGKSTHTNLWKKLFNTEILNGDLNLIGLCNGVPVTYGIPWCGTSKITQEYSYPLGGIIFLKQASEDKCIELSEDEKVLRIWQRMITPMWTAKLAEQNLDYAKGLLSQIMVCKLECTKEDSAAETIKHWIDTEKQ